ncbi:MAG: MurR/RpiR family transcriptional regulator [Ilumatobacteraceae bacterium]
MEIAELIRAHSAHLTAAERRVAEAILAAPQAVGFGTVADLASSARVGAASVVRFAAKLGFDGYSSLQESIQRDLTLQLRPAAERIHEAASRPSGDHQAIEFANVQATLDGVSTAALDELVSRLADLERPVAILSGDASRGVATQFVDQLEQLRPDVVLLHGSAVAVGRCIAVLDDDTTVVLIDLRRYERWILDAHAAVVDRGIWSAGLTDSMLSPIASRSDVAFLVRAASIGPFDSHVGTLSLLNLIAVELATALRSSATDRLARIETGWSDSGALTDEPRRPPG